jgi:hypothetical protein
MYLKALSIMFAAGILYTAVPLVRSEIQASSSSSGQALGRLRSWRLPARVRSLRNQIATLEAETADDYTTVSPSGAFSDKRQMITNLRSGKTRVVSNSLTEMKERIYGSTAS